MHHGIELRFGGQRATGSTSRELTGGRAITVYGQQEVVKDLIAARLAAGGRDRVRGRAMCALHGLESATRPSIRFRRDGERSSELDCDFIAGCDGFHGVCRDAIPAGVLTAFEREYPFAWLGILAERRRPRPRS